MFPFLSSYCAQRLTISALLLLLCATASFGVSGQTTALKLVSTEWPPFTDALGRPRFALDLVETALDRISLKAQTTIVSADEFTASLLKGPFDGSAAAWRDSEREATLVFSQPYLENRLVLVGRAGADVSARALGDLAGKRVAIVAGYSYGDGIDLTAPVFVRSRSEEDSLALLLAGKIDYTLMDALVVQYLVNNYPKETATRLQIGSTPLVTRTLHFVVRRSRPDAESIVARFNAQLRTMITDRTYHRLLQVDWILADVNGDGVAEYVPRSDQAGTSAPQRSYSLFTSSEPGSKPKATTGFYVGGNIYADWASVPASYKTIDPKYPDSRRSTASIFKFTW